MTCWPHTDLPGAGQLGEHEIDAACSRKRQIILSQEQMLAVDDTAGLCGCCGGACPAPEACELADSTLAEQQRWWRRAKPVAVALAVTIAALAAALIWSGAGNA